MPRERLDTVETALKLADWHAADLPDYDQRYYRRWRHEAPLLRHLRCTTVVNVHHAILPDTARFRPDAARLRQCADGVPDFPDMTVLAAEDRILHAATLLIHNDTLSHGLRDLSPPCIAELPLLAEAQQQSPGVQFLFVNQGEKPEVVQRFLSEQRVTLANVLLDEGMELGPAIGSAGLPTTLFVDAKGGVVARHMGLLSSASLAARLGELK